MKFENKLYEIFGKISGDVELSEFEHATLISALQEMVTALVQCTPEECPYELKNAIESLIVRFEYLDNDDFFGTEGWRHRLGWD